MNAYPAIKQSDRSIWKTDFVCTVGGYFKDEPELILQAQQGDLESFNSLVITYQDSLFNIARRILDDENLAGDATQDAFISAFRHLNSFQGGSLSAWLMRILANACYSELRRQKRNPVVPLQPFSDDGDEIETPSWIADTSMLPEALFEAGELGHTIQLCLNALPTSFRTVVILADIEGLDYGEIASIVRVPIGTVKSRLFRARLRLREHLQQFGELLPMAYRFERMDSVGSEGDISLQNALVLA
jgi:RNA polymerase sigma-70 factor (ECF subfamily)